MQRKRGKRRTILPLSIRCYPWWLKTTLEGVGNVEIDTILDILLNSNREYRLFYPAKRGIIKIRFVKKENESFIISIARQIRENHLR